MPERKSPGSKPTGSGRGPGSARGAAGKPGATGGAAKSGAAKSGATNAGAANSGAAKKTSASKVSTSKTTAANTASAKANSGRVSSSRSTSRPAGKGPALKPPARKKKKSIVNQKQRPWGLIIAAAVVVAFAAAVVGVAIATTKSGSDAKVTKGGQAVAASDPYRQPELAAAAKISGVTYRVEGQHTHVEGHIKYDATPPVGGDHSQYWADCSGTVYPKAIANENAVHMLEHGAVWITYNKDKLSAAQVKTLSLNVVSSSGAAINGTAMSPYPNLKSAISLQSWGYQLFVNSPTDPRIKQFIAALKLNKATTPEDGATCSQPTFKAHPSTFGHPLSDAAGSATGNTSGV